jgi:hypothetical protein
MRDLRSEYQVPEIPSLFGEDKPRFRLTGYAAYNRQKGIRYGVDTTYRVGYESDAETRSLHGEAAIARFPSLAGVSASYLGEHFLAGLAMGVPLENVELAHGGLFFGLVPRLGPWTPMLTVGLFLNRMHTRLDYVKSTDVPINGPVIVQDTLDAVVWDFAFPVKAGLQYQAGPAAIYLILGRSGTEFWPYPGDAGKRFSAETRDVSLGLHIPLPHGIGCAVEAGREWTEIPDRLTERHWKGRAFLMLDFP